MSMSRVVLVWAALAVPALACSSVPQSPFDDGEHSVAVDNADAGTIGNGDNGNNNGGGFNFDASTSDVLDFDAFYATDPPPMFCPVPGYVADGGAPPTPGGTLECPDDKNRQGCACDVVGKTASCWPGLRKNRNLGACHDGTTTCTHVNENFNAWGPCTGYTLPTPGTTSGKAACSCFSAGQWDVANVIPCFVSYGSGTSYAVSTVIGSHGAAQCPSTSNTPPPAKPSSSWSSDSLTVDCAGHYKLCFELKAGSPTNPLPSDCSLAKVCTEGDYPVENVATPFPDLGAWTSTDSACAEAFQTTGGYGEMTVQGKSVRCDEVDDGAGNPLVFNRVTYCKAECATNHNAPGCSACQQGGSGNF